MSDPYLYPGTNVLENTAGIRDHDAAQRAEFLSYRARVAEGLPDIDITYQGYNTLHYHLFQDFYSWAGEPRLVELAKGPSLFMGSEIIEENMVTLFEDINYDMHDLRHMAQHDMSELEGFSHRAARHICRLNYIHPFREGNGRTMRHFLKILGAKCGHEIDLARIRTATWHRASIQGLPMPHRRTEPAYEPMEGIIRDAVRPCGQKAIRAVSRDTTDRPQRRRKERGR